MPGQISGTSKISTVHLTNSNSEKSLRRKKV